MDALTTLMLMRRRGARIWVQKGVLRFEAPKGAIGSEDILQLRRFKSEIINLIAQETFEDKTPLSRRFEHDSIPLTPLQQRVWISNLQASEPHIRKHALGVRVVGELRVDTLCGVLDRLVARHDILRTRFQISKEGLSQYINPPQPVLLPIEDLSISELQRDELILERTLRDFLGQRVYLCHGPLFANKLIRITARDHILIITLHEFISDCRSNEIIMQEIWYDYLQSVRGQGVTIERPVLQFADYAVWLRKMSSHWMNAHAPYWREHLSNVSTNSLWWTRSAPDEEPDDWVTVTIPIAAYTVTELATVARQRDSFPALMVLAAYVAALVCTYDHRDILVTMVDHGRHCSELENMIGWLVNNLLLRVKIESEYTFETLLQNLATELSNAYQHRDYNWVPSFLPDLNPSFYFNWVTSFVKDPLPNDDVLRDYGIILRKYPLAGSSAPATFGVTFEHDTAINGRLVYYRRSEMARGVHTFLRLFQSALTLVIRHPTKSMLCLT